MKKIRINELARELEVKPGVIIDMLPELGVQEKKTHSSSIDEEVAIELRRRLTGSSAPFKFSNTFTNGHHDDNEDQEHHEEAGHSEHSVQGEKISPTEIEEPIAEAVSKPREEPQQAAPQVAQAPAAPVLTAKAPETPAFTEPPTSKPVVLTPRATSEPLRGPRPQFAPPPDPRSRTRVIYHSRRAARRPSCRGRRRLTYLQQRKPLRRQHPLPPKQKAKSQPHPASARCVRRLAHQVPFIRPWHRLRLPLRLVWLTALFPFPRVRRCLPSRQSSSLR